MTTRGGRDAFLAGDNTQFAARLAAAPVDGAANATLVDLVAKHFGVAKRAVTLVAGQTARTKRLTIAGDPQALARAAASLYASVP